MDKNWNWSKVDTMHVHQGNKPRFAQKTQILHFLKVEHVASTFSCTPHPQLLFFMHTSPTAFIWGWLWGWFLLLPVNLRLTATTHSTVLLLLVAEYPWWGWSPVCLYPLSPAYGSCQNLNCHSIIGLPDSVKGVFLVSFFFLITSTVCILSPFNKSQSLSESTVVLSM